VPTDSPKPHKTPREIVQEMRAGVPEALDRAVALIGPALGAEAEPLLRLMAQQKEEGNFAVWLDSLLWVSAVAEELNLDADLPPEFWNELAFVAEKLQFPEFLPQIRGKAEGRPARGLCEYIAAVAVIHREVGAHWAGCFPDEPDVLDQVIADLKDVDGDYEALIATESSPALAQRFVDDGWLEDPPPERFFPVRRGLGPLFFPLFQFINAQGFPDALADERWSVIAFNGFRVKTAPGIFPRTEARPWWN